jgi:hypothetical protein
LGVLDLFWVSQLLLLFKSLVYFLTPYINGKDLKKFVIILYIFFLIDYTIPLWLSLGYLPRTGSGYLSGWEVLYKEVNMVSGVICIGMKDVATSLIRQRYGSYK